MSQDDILLQILAEIKAMREDLAYTLALKRKHAIGKSLEYIEFEKWALERAGFATPNITAKFRVSKPTALSWMNKFCFEHENKGFILRLGIGQEPHRVIRKKAG